MRKGLNFALFFSFLLTIMVPLTGIHIHKMASAIFLILCIVHTVTYRKRLGTKTYLLLVMVILSFATGLFGMILDHIPMVLILHRCISIAIVFFMAIHIFVYHRRLQVYLHKQGPTPSDGGML